MHEPLLWSLPVGRVFGITVRLHLLFLIFIIAMVGRGMARGYATEAFLIQLLLFGSVLLHEFGHCFAARHVDGDASDILLWPLGGLAAVDIPHTPRAHFVTAAGGPAVNFVLCIVAASVLAVYHLAPPFNPLWPAIVIQPDKTVTTGELYHWTTGAWIDQLPTLASLAARLFCVNWILMLFNVLVLGFPLDGGRMLQSVLWPRLGFHRAMRIAIYFGYGFGVLFVLYVFIFFESAQDAHMLLLFSLALFMYVANKQQAILLETGGLGDEGAFGYDFSQGYTSLERDSGQPRRPRQSFWRRWLQRRAARKLQREEENRQAEERRLDELLAKVQRDGKESLTDEERRFLTRVSAKYRNRNRS